MKTPTKTVVYKTISSIKLEGWFSFFSIFKPQAFYPFDKLYALKPKNPV